MRVIVTRPGEDAEGLRRKLEAAGHEVIASPLLTIVPRPSPAIPERNWQAIAVTSANALRALGGNHKLRTYPVLAVGPQSLAAAKAAGFVEAAAHGGDVRGLARYIASNLSKEAGPLLYLSGAETSGDLEGQLKKAGFDCVRIVVYDAVPARELECKEELKAADAVLLYSPRSARIWVDLVQGHGLSPAAERLLHLCLSENVAGVLPASWRRLVAARPDETQMLALLDRKARTL